MNSNNIIEISNLKKKYGHDIILDIDKYCFKKGLSYLLVGGNGAGKSTLIKSILGFLQYDGVIKLNSSSIAYLPERIQKLDFFTINEYMNLVMSLDEKSTRDEIIGELLDKYSLNPNQKINSLSKGMFQKMNLILIFLLDRDIIFLDEPLNGLDNSMQQEFVGRIMVEKKKGKTIIISTHYPYVYKGAYDKILRIKNRNIEEDETDIF